MVHSVIVGGGEERHCREAERISDWHEVGEEAVRHCRRVHLHYQTPERQSIAYG